MNYLINEPEQLKELEPKLQKLGDTGGVIAVDTEFLREKTYNARLCLVQLGFDSNTYCVDVLALDDLQPLSDLFADQRILKIFHAARQDMEVIYQTLGVLPSPIFDTQLAAAFCGADMQQGYGAIVAEKTGVELGKSQARTDWTRRPLSPEQLKYAAEDVEYLEAVYVSCREELERSGRQAWYSAEIETYYDTSLYVIDPETAYLRLFGGALKRKQQYVLKALANWREAVAQKKDIPRTWVLRDDKLFELATQLPKSVEAIQQLGVFGKKSGRYLGPEAIQVIRGVEVGESPIWRKVEPLSRAEKGHCGALMGEMSSLAKELGIAQALLATRKEIESLYRNRSSKRLLKGWRKEIVGEPLLARIREMEAA